MCGHKTSGEDRYMVEAQMWYHAMSEHLEIMKDMSVEDIAKWLKDKDEKLA